MNIQEILLTPGASHGRPGYALTPKGAVVHYVGGPGGTALAVRNWFEGGAGGAHTSCHYVVGLSGEILRILPESEQAMHAGKAYDAKYAEQAAQNNRTLLGIECCHPTADGKFNEATTAALAWLLRDILARHGLTAEDVYRHYDVTGKACPLYYVKNPAAWDELKLGLAGSAVNIQYNGKTTAVRADNRSGSNWVSLAELGRAMPDMPVPVRAALESAGRTVSYDGLTNTVIVA